ncbi:hypothetical protein EW146_g8281 [Bondarzewia mesenterica]|uniref:Uncharacterized protein n=1 Tax=Bondarzewia mesenterica TaxID=1095465 RepID=A0A4S4LFP1_9AGAM|nr:hypothetical protein EW146_g8281 [Bondarzewia mesenterica]
MSASRNKKVTNLPPLPNETWLQILEWATFVPGILDPDIHDPFESPLPASFRPPLNTVEEQNEIRTSLVTKRYLVRVCKRWHALATPLLYESVYIGGALSLYLLCNSLVKSQRQETKGSTGACALGLWVRRLDVAADDFPRRPCDSETWPLPDIIHYLPKLRILNIMTRWVCVFPSTLFAIGKACGASLQKLTCDTFIPPGKTSHSLFLNLQNLRTLIAGPLVFGEHGVTVYPLAMTLSPSCDFVTLPLYMRAKPVDHVNEGLDGCSSFPFFRQVRFGRNLSGDEVPPCVLETLAVGGSKLTIAYLDLFSQRYLKSVTGALKKHCPRLAHIIVILYAWDSFLDESPVDPQFPPITHLGLSCRENQTKSSTYNSIFRYLVDFAPPSLKVVRFLNPRGVADLRDHYSEALVVETSQLRKLGIRVEDHEGNDL